MINDLDSAVSTSSLSTLCGPCNYNGSCYLYIWILVLPYSQLLCCLAFWIYRLARQGPRILITGTTTDILRASHLMNLKRKTAADKDQLSICRFRGLASIHTHELGPELTDNCH